MALNKTLIVAIKANKTRLGKLYDTDAADLEYDDLIDHFRTILPTVADCEELYDMMYEEDEANQGNITGEQILDILFP